MQEGVIAIGIERQQPLVEQDVDRLPSSAFHHELGASLAEDRRRIVDEPDVIQGGVLMRKGAEEEPTLEATGEPRVAMAPPASTRVDAPPTASTRLDGVSPASTRLDLIRAQLLRR